MFVCSVLCFFSSCQNKAKKADELRLKYEFEEAAKLYKEAADEGDAYAKWKLSRAYFSGEGVEIDEKKDLDYWRKLLMLALRRLRLGWHAVILVDFLLTPILLKAKK